MKFCVSQTRIFLFSFTAHVTGYEKAEWGPLQLGFNVS
jgi:hypothetical protein